MADTVDRKLVRAGVVQEVEERLGETWARLKNLSSKAGLNDEEKAAAALQLIEDIRGGAHDWCDMLRRRIESRTERQ